MNIQFTQYLRPSGRRKTIQVARSVDVGEKAKELWANGVALEAEVLTTGEVSLTAEDNSDNPTLAIEVVPNGPEVLNAVDRLVNRAHEILMMKKESLDA